MEDKHEFHSVLGILCKILKSAGNVLASFCNIKVVNERRRVLTRAGRVYNLPSSLPVCGRLDVMRRVFFCVSQSRLGSRKEDGYRDGQVAQEVRSPGRLRIQQVFTEDLPAVAAGFPPVLIASRTEGERYLAPGNRGFITWREYDSYEQCKISGLATISQSLSIIRYLSPQRV